MNKTKKRTVFTFIYAQLSVLILFAFVTSFTLVRLLDVRDNLSMLSEQAIPQLSYAASFNSKIQMLATQSSMLAGAQNEPARRLVMHKINILFDQLDDLSQNNVSKDPFVKKQVDIISNEINDLNALIKEQLSLQNTLTSNINKLTQAILNSVSGTVSNGIDAPLKRQLTDLLLTLLELEKESRLSSVRQLALDLKQIQIAITAQMLKTDDEPEAAFLPEIIEIEAIIEQKIELLLLNGRLRGRDSFVRSLISDLASNLEYHTELLSQDVLNASSEASKRIAKQTQLAIVFGVLATLITISILVFLYKRFVVRLLSLTRQIDAARHKGEGQISIDGSDEISHLATVFSQYVRKVNKQEKVLLELSYKDSLTGIPNRRAFEIRLFDALAQAKRSNLPLSIVMADVDFFKAFNDAYGHTEGDVCLKRVAKTLQQTMTRETDFCARYGGEEFICILTDTDLEGAKVIAEQIHTAIKSLKIPHSGSQINEFLTLSLGFATFTQLNSAQLSSKDIVNEADRALYAAKKNGRNQSYFLTV
uniref:diguanylate cyclase n=1 Tax=Ningiella ruwaisensis TaxID=2364274 RepID=UPI0010A0C192|nr:diguanylate cyclase [Ningiella ruwaisensis]